MAILVEERVVALNDLIDACVEAAALYTSVASTAANAEIADIAEAAAETRQRFADRVSDQLRAEGELPKTGPEDEFLLVKKGWMQLRGLVDTDRDQKILEDCRAKDELIVERAEAVLSHSLTAEMRQRVEQVKETVKSG